MENHKIRVAITQGDTNGVGFELIFKTFAEMEMLELCTPIVYGSPKVAAYHSKALDTQCQFSIINNAQEARDGRVNLLACFDEDIKVEFGQSTEISSMAAVKALDRALTDAREGLFDVLVCGPMATGKFNIGGFQFPGVVKYIEASMNSGKIQPVYLNEIIRMALATNGSVKDASSQLSQEKIVEQVKKLHATMKRDFRLSNPRVGILALNPTEGTEEKEILAPAVEALASSGVPAFGPYPAEAFFEGRAYEAFDVILAMYHDQGALPIRMLTDAKSIVAYTDCPLVCTAPASDAQFKIAGKNEACELPLRNAIYAAIDIFRHRKEYDAPMGNPLPKLYHERPDNGEKLRFSVPKRKEGEEGTPRRERNQNEEN